MSMEKSVLDVGDNPRGGNNHSFASFRCVTPNHVVVRKNPPSFGTSFGAYRSDDGRETIRHDRIERNFTVFSLSPAIPKKNRSTYPTSHETASPPRSAFDRCPYEQCDAVRPQWPRHSWLRIVLPRSQLWSSKYSISYDPDRQTRRTSL